MEIQITVGNKWKNEEDLAKRIARVISYTDKYCQLQDHGYKWALNYTGNDWWMTAVEDGVVKVAYRYGHGHKEMMAALQTFLQWQVGKFEG